ncbi:nacht and wd40 domain-containing protein [Moniliophthora roreri MCA 2997]|uniref:Nacht and wd40 domain-containing protein n=1 Tax=Moniliophthora roreri (strain MCA 2997) TaxID=1381753 RepID=V2XCR6_MONRO|nr:nacht and wd40 domain-containing protein [Moniliophthora roreri MCA 2997]
MAFNGSNVHVARDAKNIVYGDQINNVHGGVSSKLDDSIFQETFKLLAKKAAPNACYDSEQRFPPPNCHPGTRTRILEELSGWIEDNPKTTRVFWLYGSAGVGKSAIAQNLAETYAGKRVAAAFFFSRNDPSRDKLEPFVASIAYQFCTLGSCLRSVLAPIITETIRSDPNIFHKSSENQFEQLIVEPCSKVDITKWNDLPNAIIVDGLDECTDYLSQGRILRIIQKVVTARQIPVPWIFLIFSRPEPQIRDAFDDFGFILRSLDVNSSDEAYQDILNYFSEQFALLRKKHRRALRYEDTSWPGKDIIYQLANRADKQFIFAATVIKYIDTHDERPQDRLHTILRIYVDNESDSPYSDLDILYHQILLTCHRWEKVQPVLRLLVTPHRTPGTILQRNISWRSSETIAHLLGLKMGEVETILSRLHSVLQIPEDDSKCDIRIAHVSFTEFLSDPNRSGEYHAPQMSKSEYFDHVSTLLLHTLSTLEQHYPLHHLQSDPTKALPVWEEKLRKNRSELMEYSCRRWDVYCRQVESPSPNLCAALSKFDPHFALAVCMYYKPLPYLRYWEGIVRWAKPFGEDTRSFVETCESFFRGFCIAFPPAILQHEALWWTFELEQDLVQRFLNDVQKRLLKNLYSIEQAAMESSPEGHALLMLPSDARTIPLEDWNIAHIAKINGDVLTRLPRSFYTCKNHLELLLDDIWNDTYKIASHGWITEDDLIHLKWILVKRAEIFGILLRCRTIEVTNGKQE